MEVIISVFVLFILTVVATLFGLFIVPKKVQNSQALDGLTDFDKSLIVKYPEVDIHKSRVYFQVLGFAVVVAFLLFLLELHFKHEEEKMESHAEQASKVAEASAVSFTTPLDQPKEPKQEVKMNVPTTLVLVETDEVIDESSQPSLNDLLHKEDETLNDSKPSTPSDEPTEDEEEEEEEEIQYFDFVEQEAVPHNGSIDAWSAWILTQMNGNVIQPDIKAGLKGVVAYQIKVGPNGTIDKVLQVDGTGVGPNIDKELKRIIKDVSPKWTPAKQDGMNVGYLIEVPFNIVY